MRFQIASDLHLDANDFCGAKKWERILPVKAPNLILAGDICQIVNYHILLPFLRWCCTRYEDVFYVFGNHEFYGSSIPKAKYYLHRITAHLTNLHILDNRMVEKQGLLIAGSTLWSDIDPTRHVYFNDFNSIYEFTPQTYSTLHEHCCNFLKTVPNNALVITHHAPSRHGTSNPRYENNDDHSLNQFFASELPQRFLGWVFGHTHWYVWNTQRRLYSNPYGYTDRKEHRGWSHQGRQHVLKVST